MTKALKLLDIKYLQKWINLIIGDNICSFIILYRPPSQTHDDFETSLTNFELNLDKINEKNPFVTAAIGGFILRAKLQFKNHKTSYERNILTCSHGLHQLINEPTNLLHSSSSCIDLIFTSQPNLVMESGVQPSVQPICHHQLILAKFDLSIYYPPPYERTV